MAYEFRAGARRALEVAKSEMDSKDDGRLRYAALQLRMALEALTYDRAQMYQKELPPSEIDVWQPAKLLKVLIEIEPHADQNATYRMKREASDTRPEGEWISLGTDTVIPMKAVQSHHSALSSVLHTATIRQLSSGQEFNPAKIRAKCEDVAAALEKALASPVRANFGHFASFPCEKCSATVRRRLGKRGDSVEAVCFGNQPDVSCGAKYTVTRNQDDSVDYRPQQSDFLCTTKGCGHRFVVWSAEVKAGAKWTCPKCNTELRVGFSVYGPTKTIAPPSPAEPA